MEFEKLALEVSALKAGLNPVTPHVLQGSSGVEHRFDLLFSDGTRNYAFDFYDSVTDVQVVVSYAKKFDAGCQVSIVSPPGTVTKEAKQLALSYNMHLLTPEAAETFFALERAAPRRTFD
ncbi:MAG: hypothetical protein JRN21_05595 [Nitrososphaerota archaeon]|nr:hypothetical protein [Nitrososphaerota archaeon]